MLNSQQESSPVLGLALSFADWSIPKSNVASQASSRLVFEGSGLRTRGLGFTGLGVWGFTV